MLEDSSKCIREDRNYPTFILPEKGNNARRSAVHKHVEFDSSSINLNRNVPPPLLQNPSSHEHLEVSKLIKGR